MYGNYVKYYISTPQGRPQDSRHQYSRHQDSMNEYSRRRDSRPTRL